MSQFLGFIHHMMYGKIQRQEALTKELCKQAKEFGHTIEREICFLALHGFLHLLGFDHIEKEDETEMMGLAEELLKKFGITRGDNV